MKLWSCVAILTLCATAVMAQGAPQHGPGGPANAPAPGMRGGGMPGGGMPGGGMQGGCMMGGGMMGGGMMGGGMAGGPGRMMPMPSPAMLLLAHRQMLNLTPQQVDRLQQIQLDQQKQQIRRMADLQIALLDLMQLLRQPTPDRGRTEAAVREIGRQQTEWGLAQVRAFFDARDVLTPTQQQQLRSCMDAMMGGGACPMMGGGMMGGMGTAPAPNMPQHEH